MIGILLIIGLVALFAIGWRMSHPSNLIGFANTYEEAVPTHQDTATRLLDADVSTRHLLFTRGTGDTTIKAAGASDLPVGTVDDTGTAGEPVSLLLLGKGKTKKMVASEAITVGEQVFAAASGKVQDLPTGAGTYWCVGIAQTASTADGQLIEVQDCVPYPVTVSAG